MAKKKKKLSLEELLEQALVKEEDRPYEVPENWGWTRLEVVLSEIKNGTTIPQNKEKLGAMVTRIESIQNNQIDFNRIGYIADTTKIKEKDWYSANDIALSHINSAEHVGKTAIITEELLPLVHGMNLLRLRFNSACNAYYFYYFTQSFEYKQSIINRINMAVNQVSINQKQVKDIPLPLPPIAEQHRIVEAIGQLFKKLDTAKELVQNVLNSFENRKASILHKAFTGELTAKWRKANGVSLDEWKKKKFGEIATVKSNLVDPKDYMKFPHIAPDNIEKRTGKLLEYRTIEQDKVKSGKHRFYPGQILYSKIRPYLSKVVIIDFDGLCSADMYPIETELNTKFLWYYMLSDDFVMYASSAGSRSVLPKINQKELAKLPTVVPPILEQKEIVSILDNLLDKEQRAKELCDVIEKIELMKKSILAKAFRGELGTNDPDEKSAVELLKEVLEEKI